MTSTASRAMLRALPLVLAGTVTMCRPWARSMTTWAVLPPRRGGADSVVVLGVGDAVGGDDGAAGLRIDFRHGR